MSDVSFRAIISARLSVAKKRITKLAAEGAAQAEGGLATILDAAKRAEEALRELQSAKGADAVASAATAAFEAMKELEALLETAMGGASPSAALGRTVQTKYGAVTLTANQLREAERAGAKLETLAERIAERGRR